LNRSIPGLLIALTAVSACDSTQDETEVVLVNKEDTRLVFLDIDILSRATFDFSFRFNIEQEESSNMLVGEGINPDASATYTLNCRFKTQYLNLRWEDGNKRYSGIQTPCGKRVTFELSQENQ